MDMISLFEQPLLPMPSTSTAIQPNATDQNVRKGLDDYKVEYAKRKALCAGCRNKIMKKLLRVSKQMFFTDLGMRLPKGQAFQHHLYCFGQMCKEEYGFFLSGDKLPGFSDLKPEDQQMVMKEVVAGNENSEYAEYQKTKIVITDPELEKQIKKQTKTLQKVRAILTRSTSPNMLSQFLEVNESKQYANHELSRMIDRCADFITFGAIQKCKKCTNGNFQFAKYGYSCDGEPTAWSGCINFETTPQRTLVKFPESMNSIHAELISKDIKLNVQNRVVRLRPATIDPKRDVKVFRQREPLYDMNVEFIGKLSKIEKDALQERIEAMGGNFSNKKDLHLDGKIAFIISTLDEINKKKMSKKTEQAIEQQIHVVEASFLDDIEGAAPEETIELIQQKEISDWGSDVRLRIAVEENPNSEMIVS